MSNQNEDGAHPIEEIKEGDKVLSWNAETKQTEYKAVTAVFTRQAETILDVRIANNENGEVLGVTPEHPFYVRVHRARDNLSSDDDEGEWRNAAQLQAGDLVLRPSGEWVAVLEITERAGGERVYNFEVEGNHNYYVGDAGVLVHNSCPRITNLPVGEEGVALRNAMNNISNGTNPSWLRPNSHWGGPRDIYRQNPPLPGTGHKIYDVPCPNYARNRGARRIITNDQGDWFYTPSHYRPGQNGQPPFFQIR